MPGVGRRASVRQGSRALASPAMVRILRLAFLVAAVGLPVYAVATRWHEVQPAPASHRLGPGRAMPAFVAGRALLRYASVAVDPILSGLGSQLPVRPSARFYFVGQLGKYIPGSIWPVLAQMELGHDHNIPRCRSAAALVIAIMVSLATGLIVTVLTIPFIDGDRYPTLWWLLVPIPILGALLSPACCGDACAGSRAEDEVEPAADPAEPVDCCSGPRGNVGLAVLRAARRCACRGVPWARRRQGRRGLDREGTPSPGQLVLLRSSYLMAPGLATSRWC